MTRTSIQPSKRGANIKRLNSQQQLFVEHLAASPNFNSTEAARHAGYKNPAKSAMDMLKNPIVQLHVGKALSERIKRIEFTAEEVIRHIATALFLDPMELFQVEEDGKYRPRELHEIPPEIRRCIKKHKIKSVYNDDGQVIGLSHEYEFMDKDVMLGLALKHFGLAGTNDKALNGDSEALQTMKLLSNLLTQVEQGKNNVIDNKFIESRVIDVPVKE